MSTAVKMRFIDDRPVLCECSLENYRYQIDPYIGCGHRCHYCYVLKQAETDWAQEIVTFSDIGGRLAAELAGVAPQNIYLGWHTDPYQPCEAAHGQTRTVLELLAQKGFSANLLTKSDRVLRDIDLLTSMPAAGVSVSVAFHDESVRDRFEADTQDTAARIAALGQLKAAGLSTAALVCPVIPYLTEVEPLVAALEGTADKIWIYGLSILDKSEPSWQNVARILAEHFPDQKEAVEAAVFDRDHPYWTALRQTLSRLQADRGLDLSIHV